MYDYVDGHCLIYCLLLWDITKSKLDGIFSPLSQVYSCEICSLGNKGKLSDQLPSPVKPHSVPDIKVLLFMYSSVGGLPMRQPTGVVVRASYCTAVTKPSPSHCLEGYPLGDVSQPIISTPCSQHR